MHMLVDTLAQDFPQFTFTPGEQAYWSFATQEVFYSEDKLARATDGLLHELGHGILGHEDFIDDLDLIYKEIAAWEKAKELALTYNQTLDEEYTQTCLGSYRDWLHKRSSCPRCGAHGLQASQKLYNCLNCAQTWNVSGSHHKRPYRQSKSA